MEGGALTATPPVDREALRRKSAPLLLCERARTRPDSTAFRSKHLGLYAYRKTALDRFVKLPESPLERSERLEQLRFLENGIAIYVGETPHDSVGVDTEEDLQRVIEILRKR